MKYFSGVALTVCCCFLSVSAFCADTIKIGVPGSHSGDLASYGLPTLNAAKLVVKDVNAKGGIRGQQIELVAIDDECKPEKATNAATKLLSDGVVAILGHTCSGATKAALPIYMEANIAVVSPSATSPELTQSGQYPLFFRTIASDDAQAKLSVDFVLDKLNAQKIAILHDKGDYGKGYAEYSRRFIKERGKGEVVLFEGITADAVDYSSVIQKIRQSGADTLMFGGYHPAASKIVGQLKKKRVNVKFVSTDGIKVDTFIKLAGADAEGVYATGPRDVSTLEMNKAAREAHRKEFGSDPGPFFDPAYAAIQVLVNALEKAGSTETEKIVAALHSEAVDTAVGSIRFTKSGDADGVGFNMFRVENGVFVEQK